MTAPDPDPDPTDFTFLDDPQERAWLENVEATDIVANAHRMYEFMRETGRAADSFTRELAFSKAAYQLGMEYETLYRAWLNETPVPST